MALSDVVALGCVLSGQGWFEADWRSGGTEDQKQDQGTGGH